jgi:hypothetical protein
MVVKEYAPLHPCGQSESRSSESLPFPHAPRRSRTDALGSATVHMLSPWQAVIIDHSTYPLPCQVSVPEYCTIHDYLFYCLARQRSHFFSLPLTLRSSTQLSLTAPTPPWTVLPSSPSSLPQLQQQLSELQHLVH